MNLQSPITSENNTKENLDGTPLILADRPKFLVQKNFLVSPQLKQNFDEKDAISSSPMHLGRKESNVGFMKRESNVNAEVFLRLKSFSLHN